MKPRVRHLLLDFDNLLARYRRERRVAHLAARAGAPMPSPSRRRYSAVPTWPAS